MSTDAREAALTEAYWKLREHASSLRSTDVYRRAQERAREVRESGVLALGSDWRARMRFAGLERHARGIEAAAGDLAEMLGVEEYEIEEPTHE